ncbi:hypothetical protein HOLDEFILI_01873 [Holdemania filiformis DSM 12042]|uniref:Uncharacterized protein n=1 Tax=Holdemania filiformis DSM 12042 TaxID=545696 RepID=B9Y7S8_9FIRM|nr:hypothetical protein HOLDEFILI_01873 [Holdemania filiformis DSM 12042]
MNRERTSGFSFRQSRLSVIKKKRIILSRSAFSMRKIPGIHLRNLRRFIQCPSSP